MKVEMLNNKKKLIYIFNKSLALKESDCSGPSSILQGTQNNNSIHKTIDYKMNNKTKQQ